MKWFLSLFLISNIAFAKSFTILWDKNSTDQYLLKIYSINKKNEQTLLKSLSLDVNRFNLNTSMISTDIKWVVFTKDKQDEWSKLSSGYIDKERQNQVSNKTEVYEKAFITYESKKQYVFKNYINREPIKTIKIIDEKGESLKANINKSSYFVLDKDYSYDVSLLDSNDNSLYRQKMIFKNEKQYNYNCSSGLGYNTSTQKVLDDQIGLNSDELVFASINIGCKYEYYLSKKWFNSILIEGNLERAFASSNDSSNLNIDDFFRKRINTLITYEFNNSISNKRSYFTFGSGLSFIDMPFFTLNGTDNVEVENESIIYFNQQINFYLYHKLLKTNKFYFNYLHALNRESSLSWIVGYEYALNIISEKQLSFGLNYMSEIARDEDESIEQEIQAVRLDISMRWFF